MKEILARIANSEVLSEEEAEIAFDIIMSGDATPAQIGGFLMALRVRGESITEITGATRIIRRKALTLDAPKGTIDTCGTGGDYSGTYNISTAAALVIAACNVPVAKHGNYAISSKSGSADVLTALGVNINSDISLVRKSLWENNIGFLMAPKYHSAMRHVSGTRIELATKTIFNLLGPLTNPARTKRQIVGVFAQQWIEPLAHVLGRLGAERTWVVHGSDGLDELTTTGSTYVAEWHNGNIRSFEITPEMGDLPIAQSEDLIGGDAIVNAKAIQRLLDGEHGPYRDIVLLNAAAALVVSDKVSDIKSGVNIAALAIDDGRAKNTLLRLIDISNLESI
jgi:anthranilate phosphoribosyltransferase